MLRSHAACVNLREGELLIALRAYLDSSGKLEDDWITLAAVAAPEGMWKEIEPAWDRILANRTPKASYIHMREVFRLIRGFDSNLGWDHNKAFGAVNDCLVYLSQLDKQRFRMFYCSVDLKAHDKLRAETYQMPDPIDMCNTFCSETVLGWYLLHFPDTIDIHNDRIHYFFDRNEDFFQPFFDKWNREKNRSEATGRWSIWNLIPEVAPVDMKVTPGIQAADIIAWGRNRQTFAQEGEMASHMMEVLLQVIPAFHVVWDEARMRQHFKPLIHL